LIDVDQPDEQMSNQENQNSPCPVKGQRRDTPYGRVLKKPF